MAAVVEEGAEQAAEPLDRRRMNLVFVTILVGMLLAALDQTIVSTALPTIVADLGGAGHLSWVVSSYLLARETARGTARDVGEGFNMPESGDAKQQLQMAIARLLQLKGQTHLPLVREKAVSR